jgi:hypothetical protein
MQPLEIRTRVDRDLVDAIPALAPLLGHRVRMTAIDLDAESDTDAANANQAIGMDEFLAHRLKRPAHVPPVSVEDMERAITDGALNGNL